MLYEAQASFVIPDAWPFGARGLVNPTQGDIIKMARREGSGIIRGLLAENGTVYAWANESGSFHRDVAISLRSKDKTMKFSLAFFYYGETKEGIGGYYDGFKWARPYLLISIIGKFKGSFMKTMSAEQYFKEAEKLCGKLMPQARLIAIIDPPVESVYDRKSGTMYKGVKGQTKLINILKKEETMTGLKDYYEKQVCIKELDEKKILGTGQKAISVDVITMGLEAELIDFLDSLEKNNLTTEPKVHLAFPSEFTVKVIGRGRDIINWLENDAKNVFNPAVVSEKKWSGDVETKWDAPEGFFKRSAEKIAAGLKRASKNLKQAMSRLTFYINRAGENLSKEDKARLEAAKERLHALYEKE